MIDIFQNLLQRECGYLQTLDMQETYRVLDFVRNMGQCADLSYVSTGDLYPEATHSKNERFIF